MNALPDRERRTIETVASDTGVPMDALYGMLKALGSEVPDNATPFDAPLRGQTEKVKAMIAERDPAGFRRFFQISRPAPQLAGIQIGARCGAHITTLLGSRP